MSKVVHLSDLAHNKAKAYCQVRGLKMSEWVASLIDHAVEKLPVEPQRSHGSVVPRSSEPVSEQPDTPAANPMHAAPPSYHALVPKKKSVAPAPASMAMHEEGLPVYEAPPFWATTTKQA